MIWSRSLESYTYLMKYADNVYSLSCHCNLQLSLVSTTTFVHRSQPVWIWTNNSRRLFIPMISWTKFWILICCWKSFQAVESWDKMKEKEQDDSWIGSCTQFKFILYWLVWLSTPVREVTLRLTINCAVGVVWVTGFSVGTESILVIRGCIKVISPASLDPQHGILLLSLLMLWNLLFSIFSIGGLYWNYCKVFEAFRAVFWKASTSASVLHSTTAFLILCLFLIVAFIGIFRIST